MGRLWHGDPGTAGDKNTGRRKGENTKKFNEGHDLIDWTNGKKNRSDYDSDAGYEGMTNDCSQSDKCDRE